MNNDEYRHDLENLRKLHTDLEKQMLNFDEVVPYERQRTSQIYSPRLLNMMLVCGAQVEAITRLISSKCNFDYDDNIPPLIRKINEKAVLSNFHIVSIPHLLQFTPFTRDLEWWGAYNELKHELKEKQFKITYATVMDAFAALAALHCLASKLDYADDLLPKILDRNHWIYSESLVMLVKNHEKINPSEQFWKSLLFEIRNVFNLYPNSSPYT